MTMSDAIYLDHAATTPLAPGVAELMNRLLREVPGNPSSAHAWGQMAQAQVDEAAQSLAELIGATPEEIIWTSGATESINLALRGVAEFASRSRDKPAHIVSVVTEHPATRDTLSLLARQGACVDWLTVDERGLIDLSALQQLLDQQPDLVSIMHVNNETGVVQDMATIAAMCENARVSLHADAAQSLGRLPLDLRQMPVALMSFSAHKIGGPKGIGALYIRRRRPQIGIAAQLTGGGQQRGLRAGTLPTHQIAGFGAAARHARMQALPAQPELARLKERLWQQIAVLPGVMRNGAAEDTAAPFLSVTVDGVHGGALLTGLMEGQPGLAVSTGAACSAAKGESSHVIRAMGRDSRQAAATIRFCLGLQTRQIDIDQAARRFLREVTRLRDLAAAV